MAMTREEEQHALLHELAQRTQLREGAAGIEAVLRTIHRAGGLTGKELARQTRLPVPVVTAIRREMERAGLVAPGPTIRLTPQGLVLIEGAWGWVGKGFLCRVCHGHRVVAGPEWSAARARLEVWFARNPTVDVTLDQSHCTPDTNLRRALYLQTQGALAGKSVLLLGDDDSVSLAIGLVGLALSPGAAGRLTRRLAVVDTDERILAHLSHAAAAEGFALETIAHDLRDPLPATLLAQFDTVVTDPPYTLAGLELFASRAVSALAPQPGKQLFLSFGHRAPGEQVALQRQLAAMGLAVTEIIPGFNEYRGAGVLAGVSQMIYAVTTDSMQPLVTDRYTGPLYTGEVRPTVRRYRCMGCGTKLQVGQVEGAVASTIEQLKAQGCPRCGAQLFMLEARTAVAPDASEEADDAG
jgi:predicted methyltransferase